MVEQVRYHYKECGLDNIYLVNGVTYVETPRGASVCIHDREGLHRSIGMMLISDKQNLTGKEFRFLRHELNQTQADLASFLGVSVQSVARWEKGRTKEPIDGPAQRLLRMIYKEYIGGNPNIIKPLRELAQLDEMVFEAEEEFGFQPKVGWQMADVA